MRKTIRDKIRIAQKYNDGPPLRVVKGTRHYSRAELSERFQKGIELTPAQHQQLFGKPAAESPKVEVMSRKDFFEKRANIFHGIKDGQPQC